MNLVFSSIITILLLTIPGFIYGYKNFMTHEQVGGMSSFLMNVVLPVLIIQSMQMEYNQALLHMGFKIIIAVFTLFFIVLLLGYLLGKLSTFPEKSFGLLTFILFFANTGSLGLPIVSTLFGPEGLFIASMVEVGVDILIFTVGILLIQLSGSRKTGIQPKNILNPGFIGIIIGLILFIFGIKLPPILASAFEKLGYASLPLAMFIIGYNLGQTKLKALVGDKKAFLIVGIKILLIPVVVYLTARYVFRLDYTVCSVLTAMLAMPTGSAAVVFSQQYNADYVFASKCVILSTLALFVTLTPLIALLEYLRF